MTPAATLSLARPARVAVPRGAVWVGWLADRLIALQRRRALARAGDERRAAAALRRWATRLQDSEPNLAADLRAAADRQLGA